jgi:hypothetical protein
MELFNMLIVQPFSLASSSKHLPAFWCRRRAGAQPRNFPSARCHARTMVGVPVMSCPLSQPAGNETAQRPLLARPRRASAGQATIGDLIENPWIPVGHFGGSGGGLDEMGRFDMAYLSYLRQHNQAVLICINGGGRRATQRRANGTSAITPPGHDLAVMERIPVRAS